ncbi:MAG: RecX family transcriptional regulator [Bacteroidota bacterium]
MAWQRRNKKSGYKRKYKAKSPEDAENTPPPARNLSPGQITGIEMQKKNAKRISIFINDKFAFGLHQDVLLQHALHSGMSLDAAQINMLVEADALLRAKEAAIMYLGHRARTEHEVRTKLRGKAFEEEIIDQVVKRLYELSYLDDEQFASRYTQNRFQYKGYGPQRIRTELRRLGIAPALIEQALEALLPANDVVARAQVEAEKRLRRLRNEKDLYKKRRKLFDFLVRRGHTSEVAREVIEKLNLDAADT